MSPWGAKLSHSKTSHLDVAYILSLDLDVAYILSLYIVLAGVGERFALADSMNSEARHLDSNPGFATDWLGPGEGTLEANRLSLASSSVKWG